MKTLITVYLFLISGIVYGQTISTDAPSVSASATSVEKNVFQIESSFDYNYNENSYGLTLPFNLLKFGITDKIELRHTHSLVMYQSEFQNALEIDLGALGFGAKYAFFDSKNGNTQIGAIAQWEISPQSTPANTFSGVLALNHSLAEDHSLGFNLGSSYRIQKNDPQYRSSTIGVMSSLMYAYSFGERWSAFIEAYTNYFKGETVLDGGSDFDFEFETMNYSGDVGILFLLKDNIQLDYVFGFGLGPDNRNYFHSLGFNIMLNHKKD